MQRITISTLAFSALLLSGCVSFTGYTLVTAGVNSIETLQVDAGSGWNLAPNMPAAGDRKTAQTWTQDGMLLDRVEFIPAVADGEPLFNIQRKDAALPVFRKDMLPNELEELAESTFVKMYGEGNAVISTSNLRPHRFGGHRGVLFDVDARVTESPDYKGTVGAFVVDDKLYFLYYFAATPYYYEKHREKAVAIIKSARLAAAPTG